MIHQRIYFRNLLKVCMIKEIQIQFETFKSINSILSEICFIFDRLAITPLDALMRWYIQPINSSGSEMTWSLNAKYIYRRQVMQIGVERSMLRITIRHRN